MARAGSGKAIWHCQWRCRHAGGRAFTVASSRAEAYETISTYLWGGGFVADLEELRPFAPTEGPACDPVQIATVLLEVGYRWIKPRGLNAPPQEIPYLVASLLERAVA